jgi:hypothetical protein
VDWRIDHDRAGPQPFPPSVRVEVKALACELPASSGVPLSRWSAAEVAREVIARGLVAEISGSTVWRWLSEEAIRPFYHRSWIFPRDPDFAHKAGRVLDLYEGNWEGEPLGPEEYVVCAEEKTSIQARHRCHPTLHTDERRLTRVEHEYERKGALAYLAAWDVHRAKLFGRWEPKNGIEPFGRLVDEVMREEPYASADRVFWIVDNGSSHRGERSVKRLEGAWPNLRLIHLPTHASWLRARSRSTSRWFNASSSPRTTSPSLRSWPNASSPFRNATSESPSRSPGSSPAVISTGSSLDWPSTNHPGPQPQPRE